MTNKFKLKPVAVVTSGYIRQHYGIAEKFVHLDDYQRLRDTKPELPEGFKQKKNHLIKENGVTVAANYDGMIHVDDHGVPKAALLAWLLRGRDES